MNINRRKLLTYAACSVPFITTSNNAKSQEPFKRWYPSNDGTDNFSGAISVHGFVTSAVHVFRRDYAFSTPYLMNWRLAIHPCFFPDMDIMVNLEAYGDNFGRITLKSTADNVSLNLIIVPAADFVRDAFKNVKLEVVYNPIRLRIKSNQESQSSIIIFGDYDFGD